MSSSLINIVLSSLISEINSTPKFSFVKPAPPHSKKLLKTRHVLSCQSKHVQCHAVRADVAFREA